MQTETCRGCGEKKRKSEMFSCCGEMLCVDCANKKLGAMQEDQIKQSDVYRLLDMTICAQCGTDYGSGELPQIGGFPFCEPCAAIAHKRPFPQWLKVAALVLAVLTAMAFVRTARYMRARMDIDRAFDLCFDHKTDACVEAINRAHAAVPSSARVADLWHYFNGLQSYKNEKWDDAISHFSQIKIAMDEKEFKRQYMTNMAQAGKAYERKDYGTMVVLARERLRSDPADVENNADLALACSLAYADKGGEEMKQECLHQLDLANQSSGTLTAGEREMLAWQRGRIEHRVRTRQIITLGEYEKQFGPAPGSKPAAKPSPTPQPTPQGNK